MNELPNAPMPAAPGPARPRSMFETWFDAVTKPKEGTYAAIAAAPNAKISTALLWVFIGSLVQSFFGFLVQGTVFRRMLEQQGLGNNLPAAGGLGGRVIGLICGAPIAAAIAVVFFAIGVALIQWVARMFGGRGTYDQLATTFAAILAPITIVSGLVTLLSAIPYVGACFGIVAGLLGLYALVLQIMATKAVNGFGYGQAAASVLIPGAVIFLVCCCLVAGLFALIGASVGNVFSGLGPFPIPTP